MLWNSDTVYYLIKRTNTKLEKGKRIKLNTRGTTKWRFEVNEQTVLLK